MSLHRITITIQWIPGHSDISMNDKADGLAKIGSHMPQENTQTSYDTARQIAKQNTMETWYNDWALGDKGRRLYQHQPKPNPNDPINQLSRCDQCNIFQLRTGHSTLHRNRIDPLYHPMCRQLYLPIEHHLLHCGRLRELRKNLLPPNPTIENCLYSNAKQLKKTF